MDEYIKRFMETLDEDERGKDIEVQVFIEGEHTIVASDEDGYYKGELDRYIKDLPSHLI